VEPDAEPSFAFGPSRIAVVVGPGDEHCRGHSARGLVICWHGMDHVTSNPC